MKIIAIIVIVCLVLLFLNDWATKTFKVGYYEQTLKNNKDLFTEERYSHIEKIMKAKTPFIKE